MPIFEYQVYDQSGASKKGKLTAEQQSDVSAMLESEGLYVVSVQPASIEGASIARKKNKLTLDDLEFLTTEISLLLKNGVKIDKGLHILAKGKGHSALGLLLSKLATAVKRGEPLSEAMQDNKVFDSLYISIVRIGETTGQLSEVFEGLARDLKFKRGLRAKVIQSITYPAVIFFVCLLVIGFVFNYIVPQLSSLFENTENLPVYTEILLNASQWLQQYQWWLLAVLAVAFVFARSAYKKGSFKGRFDDFLLKLPVISSAILQVEGIRFNNSMALMLEAGVKVDIAIGLAADNIANLRIKQALQVARDKIKRGSSVAEALSNCLIYPELMLSLLEVGEESGNLCPVFNEMAQRGRDKFEGWTTRVTSLLEPLMILVMGGIVGTVVVVMLMSIMSVNEGF